MKQVHHIPVLCKEVLLGLSVKGKTLLDMTFGGGGHTRAMLNSGAARVFALDRDLTAYNIACELANEYSNRIIPIHGKFSQISQLLKQRGIMKVDGVLFDLGLSSNQLDSASRGFSFSRDGPLDMRMDQSDRDSAYQLVNQTPPQLFMSWLREFGEERAALRIVRAICAAREKKEITSTLELAQIIETAVPRFGYMGSRKIHPATRTFQALRIVINDEMGELKQGLKQAESLLATGGRLAVISFHSLEDRIVKRFFKGYTESNLTGITTSQLKLIVRSAKRKQLDCIDNYPIDDCLPRFNILNKSPITATEAEILCNPRSRSAKLRIAENV
ncbi:16S rRNA (cytosine(1402)-N(4))-methyltransferase [Oopsacas minuta]|uniref:16S rRNA (Cytosine(1402)-N(4))-methyltransferase n=1 Tax=Oopsacas minuta TaxID=111878 RepID=A0AAV7K1G7_9METZ|nr:16S rRNA (cytosine(1402)-N(4))-methyltransferase [Oopsacas minuta]